MIFEQYWARNNRLCLFCFVITRGRSGGGGGGAGVTAIGGCIPDAREEKKTPREKGIQIINPHSGWLFSEGDSRASGIQPPMASDPPPPLPPSPGGR